MTNTLDEKALRKAWLKKKFGSFEYHEEMLQLHARWLTHIKRSVDRFEREERPNQKTKWFRTKAIPILDACARPGELAPEKWKPGQQAGFARDILDYNRDTGLDDTSTWDWMTPDEDKRLYELWGPMSRMADNIRRTADDAWFRVRSGNDDDLLNVEDTGPITWPANWQEEVLGSAGVSLARDDQALRAKGGEAAPRSGRWVALDPSNRQVTMQSGELLQDLQSPYGVTVWQWLGS
jgi:hypothetical protein